MKFDHSLKYPCIVLFGLVRDKISSRGRFIFALQILGESENSRHLQLNIGSVILHLFHMQIMLLAAGDEIQKCICERCRG
jgi:hypothetical protein